MQILASVPERRAVFSEEKHLAALNAPVTDSGTLTYRRPDFLEKDTTSINPPEKLAVDGNTLTITDPRDGGEHTIDLTSQPEIAGLVDAIRGTLAGDLPRLQSHYNVTVDGTAQFWTLNLRPTEDRIAAVISRIRIDGAGNTPRIFTTQQANGDVIEMPVNPATP
jgi:outer membrane lipoprotein-sorting protein